MTTTLLVTYNEVEQNDLRWLQLQRSTRHLEVPWGEPEGHPFFFCQVAGYQQLHRIQLCVTCRQRSKASRMLTSLCSHMSVVHILNFDWNFHREWLPCQDYISKFVSHSLRTQGWKTESRRESEPKKEGQEDQRYGRYPYPVRSEDWSSRILWWFGGRYWWTRGTPWHGRGIWLERQLPHMSGV